MVLLMLGLLMHTALQAVGSLTHTAMHTALQAVGLLAAYPPLVVDEPSKLRERVEQLCALFNCGTEQVRVGVGTWLHVRVFV